MDDGLPAFAREAGRDPATIGISGRLNVGQTREADWAGVVEAWRGLGASHLDVNTMSAGLASPQAHVDALRRVKTATGV